MDLQGALRQKDAELEQRASLLLKTKAAIEQLQEELASSRQEADKWRKAAERQGGELMEAHRQVAVLEAELEGKAHEGSAMLADTLELKRRLQEAQDRLQDTGDTAAAQTSALAGRLRDTERALAAAQADAKAAKDAATAAQADANATIAEREQALAERGAAMVSTEKARAGLEQQVAALQDAQVRLEASCRQAEARLAAEAEAHQRAETLAATSKDALADEKQRAALEATAWERLLREQQDEAAARLAAREAVWAAAQEKSSREAQGASEEARRQLTKRLYLAEGEWAKRLQQSSADWAARLDSLGAQWLARHEADKAAWAIERARMAEEMEGRIAEAETAQAAAVEEARQQGRRKVAAAEAKAAAAAAATDRAWQQRLDAAAAHAEADKQASLDSQAAAVAQREQAAAGQLVAVQEACAAKLAGLDKEWMLKLAGTEELGMRERHELERHWSDKLHAAEKAAGEAQASLRAQLEGRLAAVSERVGGLVHKEARRERKRAELMRQVVELQVLGDGERTRRQEVEAALQEASSIFRRELADKNNQLELLRDEIKLLRSLAGGVVAAPGTSAMDAAPCALSGLVSAGGISPARLSSPHPCLVASPACCNISSGRGACGSSAGMHHTQCFSAPASPAGTAAADAAAAAARAVEAEVRALRSARRAYQRAMIGQQELCSNMTRTINEALKNDGCASPLAMPPLRPHSAGNIPAAGGSSGRGKWKRDLAAELQSVCSSFAGGMGVH